MPLRWPSKPRSSVRGRSPPQVSGPERTIGVSEGGHFGSTQLAHLPFAGKRYTITSK